MAGPCWWGRGSFMKHRWFCAVGVGLLAAALTSAQQPGNDSSNAPSSPSSNTLSGTLTFENGTLANGVYSNECFGFSLPIPAGWEVNDAVTASGKARHRSDGSLVLVFLHQHGTLPGRIILSARDSAGRSGGAQAFVSDAVHAQVNSPTEKRELVRDTFAVDYAGRHFFRSDYKALVGNGIPLYLAYVYTDFRGYFIGETLASASPEGLDEAASSLQQISFRDDQPNPKCVMGGDNNPNAVGVVGGVPSSQPPPKIATPGRVRISSGVAVGLLMDKVPPQYPDGAKQARIQGQVVLRAEIDKDGNIEKLTTVSGDPLLAPAALEAVKQWKYKPYLLNGQPVNVETEVIVNFTLSRF
jgi:TonB family protein